MKHRPYIQTRDLTKSFQWEQNNSYEQQDVQVIIVDLNVIVKEFCHLLFDAIEDSTKTTLVHDLFEGTSISYVKCLECQNESARTENFLDVGLTVKNQFDKV